MAERELRQFTIVVSADEEELQQIRDRIGQAICVPADHHGACVTPWTTMTVKVDDLDEPGRSGLRALMSDD
jgi:hypothetical protein